MVSFGVAFHEVGKIAELGRALQQVRQRLADGGEVLVEVGRHLGQVVALGRLGGQAEADPDRVDRLQGLLDGRLVDLDRLPALVEVFLADAAAGRQFLAPFEIGLRQLQASPSCCSRSPRRRGGWRSGCSRPRWRVRA